MGDGKLREATSSMTQITRKTSVVKILNVNKKAVLGFAIGNIADALNPLTSDCSEWHQELSCRQSQGNSVGVIANMSIIWHDNIYPKQTYIKLKEEKATSYWKYSLNLKILTLKRLYFCKKDGAKAFQRE